MDQCEFCGFVTSEPCFFAAAADSCDGMAKRLMDTLIEELRAGNAAPKEQAP